MKNLKMLALLGLGCCLLACSRQKASESPQSRSSDSLLMCDKEVIEV